jgi:hypothetical protein
MKKKPSRLTLSRETIRCLNESALRQLPAAGTVPVGDSQDPACCSPLCGPTYWASCENCLA